MNLNELNTIYPATEIKHGSQTHQFLQVCPHCGNGIPVCREDVVEGERECKCSSCGKKYTFYYCVTVECVTSSSCELNGEDHDYVVDDNLFGQEICKNCGKMKCSEDWPDGTIDNEYEFHSSLHIHSRDNPK